MHSSGVVYLPLNKLIAFNGGSDDRLLSAKVSSLTNSVFITSFPA